MSCSISWFIRNETTGSGFAQTEPNVAKYLTKKPKKVIFVNDKLTPLEVEQNTQGKLTAFVTCRSAASAGRDYRPPLTGLINFVV